VAKYSANSDKELALNNEQAHKISKGQSNKMICTVKAYKVI